MKFEKEFVRCVADDELLGKSVFYADDIISLAMRVNEGVCIGVVQELTESAFPFKVNDEVWVLVYYDPYYKLKQAYYQGKAIELYSYADDEWLPLDEDEPTWHFDPSRYRIAEDKPITNKEFARWVGNNNGQWGLKDTEEVHNGNFTYRVMRDYEPIMPEILVRKWEDTEWVKPTREYLGLDS